MTIARRPIASIAQVDGLSDALHRWLYLPQNALPNLRSSIASVDTERVEILVLGDSISAGNAATNWLTGAWPSRLRDTLQADYGGTSRGYVSVAYSAEISTGIAEPNIAYVTTGTWVRSYSGTGACSISTTELGATLTAQVVGDSIKVVFTSGGVANSSTPNVTIDGTDKGTVNIKTYSLRQVVATYSGLGPGAHTVVIENTEAKSVTVNGIVGLTGSGGITVHNVSVGGSKSTDFTATQANNTLYPAAQNNGDLAYDPSLAIIAFGTNDCTAGSTADQYHAALSFLLDKCSLAGIDAMLVSFSHSPNSANDAVFYRYPDVAQRIAREYGIPYVNMWGFHGHNNGAARLASGYYADASNIHPVDAGHAHIASVVRSVLAHYGI